MEDAQEQCTQATTGNSAGNEGTPWLQETTGEGVVSAGVADADPDVDPAFVIDFCDDQTLHQILGLPGITPIPGRVRPATPLPAPGANPAARGQAFRLWVDQVAVGAGMSTRNFTRSHSGQRRLGMFDGVTQHVADAFESDLQAFNWSTVLGATTSAGDLYRFAPTGPGSATITGKECSPFR
jgi:hypothetical protein